MIFDPTYIGKERSGSRLKARTAKLLLLSALTLGAPTLGDAAPARQVQMVSAADSLSVAQALYGLSNTKQAAEVTTDGRILELHTQIEALQKQAVQPAAKLAAQLKYVAELAKHDTVYARDVDKFRNVINDIAASVEGEAALRLFNSDDEPGALQALDKLRAAHDQARGDAGKLESAAEGRLIAALAMEALARGKVQAPTVIARFEELTKLDVGAVQCWLKLSQLYRGARQLDKAQAAARSAGLAAKTDHERATAWMAEAAIFVQQRDLTNARTQLLRAYEAFKRLAVADPRSALLQEDLAVSATRLGDVLEMQDDLPGARARLQESVDIRKRLASADPRSGRAQESYASSLTWMTSVLTSQKDWSGARERIEAAIDIRKRLVAISRSRTQQEDIAQELSALGYVLKGQKDLPGARARFAECLEVRRRLLASDSKSIELQENVVHALHMLGDVQEDQGDLVGARTRFEESLNILRRLVAERSSTPLRIDLASSLERLGQVLSDQGKLVEARTRFTESVDIRRRLAVEDTGIVAQQRRLFFSLDNLGSVLLSLDTPKDLAAALQIFQESVDLTKRLSAAHPQSTVLQRDVAFALVRLGDLGVALGDLGFAYARHVEALEMYRKLAAAEPKSTDAQRNLAYTLQRIGSTERAQGSLGNARDSMQESLEILKQLAAAEPSSSRMKDDVAHSLMRLGDVMQEQGTDADLRSARVTFQECLDIRKQLAAADASAEAPQRRLAVSLSRLGGLLDELEDLEGAREFYQQSLDVIKRAATAHPGSASLQRDLANSLIALGDLLKEQEDLEGARSLYQQSLDINKRLATAEPGSRSAQRAVWMAMRQLANIPAGGISWMSLAMTLEDLQKRGLLSDEDEQYLDEAHAKAQSEKGR